MGRQGGRILNFSGGKRASEKRRSRCQGAEKTRVIGKKGRKRQREEKKAGKAAERQRIAEEKAAKKAGRTGRKRSTGERSVNQGNQKEKSTDDQGLQRREISSSECAAMKMI